MQQTYESYDPAQYLPAIPKNVNSDKNLTLKSFWRALKFALQTYAKAAPLEITARIVLTIVKVVIPVAITYYFKLIIDSLVAVNTIDVIIPLLIYTGLLKLVSVISDLALDFLGLAINRKLNWFYTNVILGHFADLSISQMAKPGVKDLLMRVGSIEVALQQYLKVLEQLIDKPILLILNLVIIFPLSPIIGVLILITVLYESYYKIKDSSYQQSIYYAQSGYSQIAMQYSSFWGIDKVEDRKVYRLKNYLLGRLNSIHDLYNKENKESQKLLLIPSIIGGLSWLGLEIGNFISLANGYIYNGLSIGDLAFYRIVFSRISTNSHLFTYNIASLGRYTYFLLDTLDLLSMEAEDRTDSSIPPKEIEFKQIELKNITFRYPNSNSNVIENLSLTIKHGEKIAFVGRNGSGKTTLVSLLLRLYKPDAGEIVVTLKNNEKVNLSDISLQDWYYSLNYVPQNYSSNAISVKENVAIGHIEKLHKSNEIVSALKNADLWEDLSKKVDPAPIDDEEVLKQYLGKNFRDSIELSGGQWQKVAIARAMLNMNGSLAILDEPSSKLDVEAEEKLFSQLLQDSSKKTVIFISHRYSTVKDADTIYVINEGKIAESGTHKELLSNEKYYAKMFKKQAEKFN